MLRQLSMCLLLGVIAVASAGCCCVQGMPDGACCVSGCGTCGAGPLANLASCRGACGEVYVDEWISEPPVVDNCGYDCGGCGRCRNCQPVRNLIRLLWGRPYIGGCTTGLCGPSCDGVGGSVGYDDGYTGEMIHEGGYAPQVHSRSNCNCGQSHSLPSQGGPLMPMPRSDSVTPPRVAPELVPPPAPSVTPTSAKRLNPALGRHR